MSSGTEWPVSAELPLDGELAMVAARMSGLLLSRETVESVLELIVSLAGATIASASGVGATLIDDHGELVTTAASSELVHDADALQYELGEGPCMAALTEFAPMRTDDIATERRWNRWCTAVAALGLRAVLSVPLITRDRCHGAIKLYSTTPGAFGPSDEHTLTKLATRAAPLLASARAFEQASRLSEQFKRTIADRDLISMAKGVLMGRDGVDEETAFASLLALSRAGGRHPREVAAELIDPARRRR